MLLLFVGVYQFLKYQKPLEIEIVEMETFKIYGKYFEGDWQDESLKSYFRLADSIAKKGDLISSAIYYNDPNEEDGYMKTFVGVLASTNPEIPVFDEIREMEKGKYLFGKISHNYFQMPSRIYIEMENFAKDNSVEIGEFSVEQYFSDSLMIVYIPIISE